MPTSRSSLLSPSRVALTVAAACAMVIGPAPAAPVPVLPATDDPANDPFSAVLQPSEEATTLLARAEQGIQRQDWKLTIDSLQRIIELPGQHVLTSDGRLYESARRHAHRRLASLPPAGLAAYRLMYDGEAAALLEQARADHDESRLRTLAEQFLLTRWGDDAAVTMAECLMDDGRFAEAAAVLQRVEALYPDSDLPPWVIPSRRAACAAAMGHVRQARAILDKLGPSLPEDRAAALRAFAEKPGLKREPDDSGPGRWPMALGTPARDGRMPAVEPTFRQDLPWQVRLPTQASLQGSDTLWQYARARGVLPVRSLVTDGKRLIVKGERELLALDADAFAPLWMTRVPLDARDVMPEAQAEQSGIWGEGGEDTLARKAFVRSLLHDSVGGSVNIAFGLALTVDWPGEPPHLLPEIARQGAARAFRLARMRSTRMQPNQVLAYDLEDGSLRWKTADPDTRLGDADEAAAGLEFLAAPVPVGSSLLAPCRIRGDLYAAVLDPATGELREQVYLCGTGGGPFDSLYALEPCVADGVVYIPTGRGLLVALEASTWSIRWAVRYERIANEQEEGELGWLPTPAIAVSDVVLLAPGDANALLCFDRGTGELRWRLPRGEHRYVLGATDTSVWLGGEAVRRVDVESGQSRWEEACSEPVGRGAVAGDRIYLPTAVGAMALDAQSGEVLAVDLPLEPLRLGNLIAWDGSLYSISPLEVRKYPDLQKGYIEAKNRHQADPADAPRAIRLAWLELLRHEPAAALAALAEVPAGLKEADASAFAQVNHLRVRCMLDLAASGEVGGDEALQLLAKARSLAESPSDALETALALADQHRREGQPLEACRQYRSLMLSAEGDPMIEVEPGFERQARLAAADKLADAIAALEPAEAEAFAAGMRERLREAISGHDHDWLERLAESPSLGEACQRAALVLGTWAARDLRGERAEGLLTGVLRHATAPEIRAEAAARLAAIYLQGDELHQPVGATRLLDQLETEYATLKLPADVLQELGDEPMPALAATSAPSTRPAARLTAAEVAAKLRERVDRDVLGRHQAALAPVVLGVPGPPTGTAQDGARPLSIRGPRREPMAGQLLTLIDGRRVEARTAQGGNLLWPADLRLLDEPAIEAARGSAIWQRQSGAASVAGMAAWGVGEGQTLVVNSARGLHAIGLRTGCRLWSRRFDPPALDGQEPAGSDAWMWTHDGVIVSVSRSGWLEAAHLADGHEIVWRRRELERQWRAVRARGDYVVAVDPTLEQVDVFGLTDGRRLGQCRFAQGRENDDKVNITLYDEVICGPAGPNEVVAWELAAPGAERWRMSMPDRLSQLFKPTADLLALADRSGHVKLVDPASGKERLAATVYACENGVTDGALVNDVLYVIGFERRLGHPNQYDQQRRALAAVDARTGRLLWQRGELPARAYLTADLLRASSNAIPVATLIRTFTGQNRDSAGRLELTILDKATGDPLGGTVPATLGPEDIATRIHRILDVDVRPGMVIVTVGGQCLRFPVDIEADS